VVRRWRGVDVERSLTCSALDNGLVTLTARIAVPVRL
jgi:hypothetical protein